MAPESCHISVCSAYWITWSDEVFKISEPRLQQPAITRVCRCQRRTSWNWHYSTTKSTHVQTTRCRMYKMQATCDFPADTSIYLTWYEENCEGTVGRVLRPKKNAIIILESVLYVGVADEKAGANLHHWFQSEWWICKWQTHRNTGLRSKYIFFMNIFRNICMIMRCIRNEVHGRNWFST